MSNDNVNYNEDELVAPEWLNIEFITKVLQQSENAPNLHVLQLHFTPATVLGDHYASVMFRATVTYQLNKSDFDEKLNKSLIVKIMPEKTSAKNEIVGDTQIFETEVAMYEKVLPEYERRLKAVGDNTKFGARCVYHASAPHEIIIFEDLCALGYQLVRKRFVTFDEAKAAYTKLAKCHALSFVLNTEQPKFFDKFRYHFLTMPNMLNHGFMMEGLEFLIDVLNSIDSLKQYAVHFERMRGQQTQLIFKCFEEYFTNRDPKACYVLLHGDFHSKNVMFKTNSKSSVVDCLLVDFQMCSVGSPVLDLIYSMYSLMDATVRRDQRDLILAHYFNEFTETLQKTAYKGQIPSVLEWKQSFLKHKNFEFFMLHTFLPIFYGFLEAEVGVGEIMVNSELRRSYYQREEYISELHNTLPRFQELGYFNEDI